MSILQVKILNDKISLPSYGTEKSAGLDLRTTNEETITIQPNELVSVGTGLAIYLDDPNTAAIILPRSGMGSKGLILGNTVGLIDADYQGELILKLGNRGTEPLVIEPYMRVAQLVIMPIIRPTLELVQEFSENTERGAGGFGSTGTN